MKKKILASVLCLAMVASMTACGSDNKDKDTSQGSSTASGDVTIRWSWWGDTTRHELYNR